MSVEVKLWQLIAFGFGAYFGGFGLACLTTWLLYTR